MKGSVELVFSDEAREDLSHVGRIARSLLPVAIRDRLVTSLEDVETVPQGVFPDAEAPSNDDATESKWWIVPVGDYRVILRPVNTEGSDHPTGFVARILDEHELDALREEAYGTGEAAPSEEIGTGNA